ncbi:phosphotransferase family protein [Candidatus Protofrankia californiensis]|uniref:phosphotransferase family protein n=1 Tax=Candidatus Protofrankia californiensis TaxID=1839754 RepID=UPI0010419510|nr:phosphotransferase family protein [Candidatus Protofrankia californiensis]
MTILDAPADQVERDFAARLGHSVHLLGRRLAGEGLSDETGLLTFDSGGEELTLVVRLFRPGAVARHEVAPERLHRLLTVLAGAELPVPRPLWFEASPELFGGPYSVVSRMPGTAVVPWSPEGRRFLAEAGKGPIGEQFCRVLAEIHGLDWQADGLGFLGDLGRTFAVRRVDELADYLSRVRGGPEPVLADGLCWLRAHIPDHADVSLVHGDYRTGNMLFAGDAITAVLDWEFAALGDPLSDVGWVCCPSNRMGSDRVCMLLPQESFLRRYERCRGQEVDRAALRFWIVYHQVRHAVMWLEAGRNFELEFTDDLRLARMHSAMPTMRRMVADLLVAS